MIPVRDTPSGATFKVKVHPRAKKNGITGEVGDALKLALTAPPLEGRANQACVEFLAEVLNVARSSVTIAAGESSRNKVIRVTGMTAEEVGKRLAVSCGLLAASHFLTGPVESRTRNSGSITISGPVTSGCWSIETRRSQMMWPMRSRGMWTVVSAG